MMRYIATLLVSFLTIVQTSFAKNYAYVYIEGDKQTPFYVKLEGQMLPRLGKNYCIMPNLDAGITNIEILFQQNKFPAQKFVIKVPEGGSRGFLLQKVNDRQFALYDMQQGIYLVSGNTADDDQVPVGGAAVIPPAQNTPPVTSDIDADSEIPAFNPSAKSSKKTSKKNIKIKVPVTEQPAPKEPATGDNRFISDLELNADGTNAATLPEFKKDKNKKGTKKTTADNDHDNPVATKEETAGEPGAAMDQGIPNSDCKSPMSSDEFENFALKILDKSDDDARLKVLTKNKGKLCFTTEQVRIIANNLDTQSGRYEVVKLLYAQTSDQSNYPQLESLFKTNYLKGKFREIINPKQ